MFSKAKRFNYPQPQTAAPTSERYRHAPHQSNSTPRSGPSASTSTPGRSTQQRPPTSTPTSRPSTSKEDHQISNPPKDFSLMLNRLEDLEKRMEDNCTTLDCLCHDLSRSPGCSADDGFYSSRSSSSTSSSHSEENVAPALELQLFRDPAENLMEICEMVAEMLCQKLEKRREKNSFWNKLKSWVVRVNGCVKIMMGDFIRPKVVDTAIIDV